MATIEDLEKRIAELEKKLNKDNTQLFGRSYGEVGALTSDLILKTRGQVKIQFGSKFIDLIKDGKLNADASFIYQLDSIGTSDGIYVIGSGDSQQVILLVNGEEINLLGESSTSYVSFLEKQDMTSDQKYQALLNIGFIYEKLSDVPTTNNGVVYVEATNQLYTIIDGAIALFTADIPSVFTSPITINTNSKGSAGLTLTGKGTNNGLLINSLRLYDDYKGIISHSSGIVLQVGTNSLTVDDTNATIPNLVIKNIESSVDGNFSLHSTSSGTSLTVSTLNVTDSFSGALPDTYAPTYYYGARNIIASITEISTDDYSDINANITDENLLLVQLSDWTYCTITLYDSNTFAVGDTLCVYDVYNLTVKEYTPTILYISSNNEIIIKILGSTSLSHLVGRLIYKICDLKIGVLEKISETVETSETDDDTETEETNESKTITTYKYGILGDYALIKDLHVGETGDTVVTTTELSELFPIGTIIMFNSASNIPSSWAICDGTNGTPNLIGKFIKADNKLDTGGSNNVTISADNLPDITIPSLSVNNTSYTLEVETAEITLDQTDDTTKLTVLTSASLSEKSETLSTTETTINNSNSSITIEPEYYSLIFIMKIK